MATELYIPKMSDHMEEAVFLEWLVTEGEAVRVGQPLLVVETDKVDAEVESPAEGVIKGMRDGLVEGARLRVGEVIAFIAEGEEAVPTLEPWVDQPGPSPVESSTITDSSSAPSNSTDIETEGPIGSVAATPAARRVARELGIELEAVRGTGPNGRIEESDVRNRVQDS